MERRGLHGHELANKAWCYYFVKGQLDNDNIHFIGVRGEKNRRAMIGYRRFKKPDGSTRVRHWHFAVSAKSQLFPVPAYSLRTHVLFSDDGENIWESDSRLHRARMSQCANWWNDDWRDRLLAFVAWLSQRADAVSIPLSSEESLRVGAHPVTVVSPITYEPPAKARDGAPESPDDEDAVVEDFDGDELLDEEGE
jgi:hypothetical protein